MRLRANDQVYFRHREGPKVGRVLCHGKHGATVDCDGNRHQVKWADILGHKERVTPSVRVVDRGADGAIVEHDDGERIYLSGLDLDAVTPKEKEDEPSAWDKLGMKKSAILFGLK